MPGMAKPTMFDDMPTKRPHFFFLIAGKKYFALKKCESRFVAIVFSPRRQVEFLDRAVREITRVIHDDTEVHRNSSTVDSLMYRCRGRRMTHRFTPTAPPLAKNLSRDVSKTSAIDFGNVQHLVTTLAAKQSLATENTIAGLDLDCEKPEDSPAEVG
jgi:hypothetical protein